MRKKIVFQFQLHMGFLVAGEVYESTYVLIFV